MSPLLSAWISERHSLAFWFVWKLLCGLYCFITDFCPNPPSALSFVTMAIDKKQPSVLKSLFLCLFPHWTAFWFPRLLVVSFCQHAGSLWGSRSQYNLSKILQLLFFIVSLMFFNNNKITEIKVVADVNALLSASLLACRDAHCNYHYCYCFCFSGSMPVYARCRNWMKMDPQFVR